ncbi:uncharacterized protein [Coffea arabica]|uniref:Uncharacterized protein n=1 Tax=Coffea arabica TaxID=13443 RepID=A0ABM4VYU9_COFAR
MILRSGKKIKGPTIPKDKSQDQIDKELKDEGGSNAIPQITSDSPIKIVTNPPPFPNKLAKPKKQEKERETLDMFRRVKINIPLLDTIKQILRYTKFLKDIYVNKKKLKGDEKIVVRENVSAVLQRKLPLKCGDPDIFFIPCKIGNTKIRSAMLDLGIFINVMPKAIYVSLNLGPLKETDIII